MSPEQHRGGGDLVLAEREGHVQTLTLNRPERHNATTPAMRKRFFTLLQEADTDPGVRCVVVTGVGRGFWPGEDHAELTEIDGGVVADRARHEQVSYDLPQRMSTPIVAAVNGSVAGVGLSFVLQADIRVAAKGAKWAASFAGLGLVAEAGISWSLPRHVGWGHALEILLTAEPFLSEDAARMGLVQHLEEYDDVLPVARAVAARIARNSPSSIRNIREQVRLDWTRPWAEAYADGTRRALEALDGEDFRTAMDALTAQRPVRF